MSHPADAPAVRAALADPARLAAVHAVLAVGDEGSGAPWARHRFDHLAAVAARALGTAWAALVVVDRAECHVVGAHGLAPAAERTRRYPARETPCVRVLAERAPVALGGAAGAALVPDWPIAARVGGAVAYLGVPVCEPGDTVVAVLSVLDDAPRAWRPEDVALLRDLARFAESELALRLEARARRTAEGTERRFRAIVERTQELMVLLDPIGTIRYASPAFGRVLGLDPIAAVGESIFGRVHPDDAEAGEAQLAELVAAPDRAPRGARVRVLGADGAWRTLDVIGENLLDDPDVRAVVLSGRDVTEQQRLEEQFRQAQKLEALGLLASGVAHDFNNLLTVLSASVRFVRDGLDDAAPAALGLVAPDLDEIERATARATSLTRQLLAFARRQPHAPRRLQLDDVVRGMEGLLRRLVGPAVEIAALLADGATWVHADPGQLEQVLLNLAVNARDAMPEGGTLVLETRDVTVGEGRGVPDAPALTAGTWATLEVTDTGVGMDAATQARIFEPFFTTKPPGQGTGLGLATVYGIVRQAGGHVTVRSAPGRGTSFRLWFPSRPGERRDDGRPPRTALPAARPGERVLVVDAEASVREAVGRTLAALGYGVAAARDAAEALARLDQADGGAFTLVLVDVTLPGMGGRALIATLRGRDPAQRLLATSGYAQREVLAWAGGAGVRVLAKPFTAEALAVAVRAAHDGSAADRRAVAADAPEPPARAAGTGHAPTRSAPRPGAPASDRRPPDGLA